MGKCERGQFSSGPSDGWERLHAAVGRDRVDYADLGQYVVLRLHAGPDAAAQAFPAVATHLAAGCASCRMANDEITAALLADPDG